MLRNNVVVYTSKLDYAYRNKNVIVLGFTSNPDDLTITFPTEEEAIAALKELLLAMEKENLVAFRAEGA